MAGMVAVTLEGVLRTPYGNAPVPEGVQLYSALTQVFRVAVVLDDVDRDAAALWLKKEGFRDYVLLHPQRLVDRSMPVPRLSQYQRLRAQGNVELVIDPDPAAIAGAMRLGLTGLLFAQPKIARPEFRPDYEREPRPWGEIVSEVEYQRTVEPPTPVE